MNIQITRDKCVDWPETVGWYLAGPPGGTAELIHADHQEIAEKQIDNPIYFGITPANGYLFFPVDVSGMPPR